MRSLIATILAFTLANAMPVPGSAAVSSDVLAGAKREGAVVWYTTLDNKTLAAISARFAELHPEIALKTLVLSTQEMGARLTVEQRGHNVSADLVSGDGFQLSELAGSGILQSYRPSESAKFIKGAVDPNGLYTDLFVDTIVMAWNPARLRAAGLKPPATISDLTKPEWKGRVGMGAASYSWLAGVEGSLPNAAAVVRKLADNHPFISANHFSIMSQLESGEFDVTPDAYGHLAELDRVAGKAVDFAPMRPQLLSPIPVGLVKDCPHPNAGRVLLEWLLSREGQQLIATQSGRTSARTDVASDPRIFRASLPYYIIPAPDRAHYNDVAKRYSDTFGLMHP